VGFVRPGPGARQMRAGAGAAYHQDGRRAGAGLDRRAVAGPGRAPRRERGGSFLVPCDRSAPTGASGGTRRQLVRVRCHTKAYRSMLSHSGGSYGWERETTACKQVYGDDVGVSTDLPRCT
jgi:hypothetical protein